MWGWGVVIAGVIPGVIAGCNAILGVTPVPDLAIPPEAGTDAPPEAGSDAAPSPSRCG
jgi:hypothetical protein